MSREISLFADYHQDENSVTNFCGLILKLLYEDNPNSFEEVLCSLSGDNKLRIGPKFTQQNKQQNGIPDLSINQQSISIVFENKLTNWHYSDQITRHLDDINKNSDIKILFLISNFSEENYKEQFPKERLKANENNVILSIISYEEVIEVIKETKFSESYGKILEDFELYLDCKKLLPRWKYLLDVVNCATSLDEVSKGAYMCSDVGGAYSHRRAKFFGPYSNKEVTKIYEIKACVHIEKNLEGEHLVKWRNATDEPDGDLIEQAIQHIQNSANRCEEVKKVPIQVFLLVNEYDTSFRKTSRGGMFQSKKYFWDIAKDYNTSEELAENLKGKTWI